MNKEEPSNMFAFDSATRLDVLVSIVNNDEMVMMRA